MKALLVHYREWFARNDQGYFLARWLLLTIFFLLYWWQVDRLNALFLGSHWQNSIGIGGFIALLLLPRRFWVWPIVVVYLSSNIAVLGRSFGMVHADHLFYFEHPLRSISEGLPIYRSGTEYPVAYFPWSSLIFYPYWKLGFTDLRYLFIPITAIAGYFLYRSQEKRPEALPLLLIFLFNGFIHESNLFMFVSNAPFIFFLFLGLWLLRGEKYSLLGAVSIALSAAIKQQGLLLLPLITVWWLYRRRYKEIGVALGLTAALLGPFILQDPGQFYQHTIRSFTDYYAARHYEYFHHFWRWNDVSIHNLVALFPGGVDWAWARRAFPLAPIAYLIGLFVFARRRRSWNELLTWHAGLGILFFFLTLSINWAIYYLVFLFSLGFLKPTEVEGYHKANHD